MFNHSNDKATSKVYVQARTGRSTSLEPAKKYTINGTFMTANKAGHLPRSPVVNYCFIASEIFHKQKIFYDSPVKSGHISF